MYKSLLCALFFAIAICKLSVAQPDRWQQRIKYAINVKMDVQNNQFAGIEQIDY